MTSFILYDIIILVRGNSSVGSFLPASPGGQKPIWLHQRDRGLRNDGKRPGGGAKPKPDAAGRAARGGQRHLRCLRHGRHPAGAGGGAGIGCQDHGQCAAAGFRRL